MGLLHKQQPQQRTHEALSSSLAKNQPHSDEEQEDSPKISIILDKKVLKQHHLGDDESSSSPMTTSTASTSSLSTLMDTSHNCPSASHSHAAVEKSCLKVKTLADSLNSSSRKSSSSRRSHRRNSTTRRSSSVVCFSTVEVRSYSLVLGDNPSTEYGPPITLSWEPQAEPLVCKVTDFEAMFHGSDKRRHKSELRIPKFQRVLWLLDEGYTRKDLWDAEKRVLAIQRARFESAEESLAKRERADSVKRKFKRMVGLKKKSDTHLYQEWKQAQQQQQCAQSHATSQVNTVISCS